MCYVRYWNFLTQRAIILLLLLFAAHVLQAQEGINNNNDEPLYPRLGVYGTFVLPFYGANFSVFPGYSMCICDSTALFRSGGGFGVTGGVLFQQPLSPSTALQVRLGYVLTSGTMTRPLDTLGTAFVNNQPVIMRSEYIVSPQLGMIAVEPRFVWMPLVETMSLNLGLHLGVEAAWIQTRSVQGIERLLTPENVGFPESGLRTRSLATSAVNPGTPNPFYLAIMGAISYDFPLGESAWITPEISYHFNVLSLTQSPVGVSPPLLWTMNTLRIGASLTFDLMPPQPPKPVPVSNEVQPPMPREIIRDKPITISIERREAHVSGVVSDMRNLMAVATVIVRDMDRGTTERYVATRNAQFDEMLPLGARYEIFAERASPLGSVYGVERTNSIIVDARSQVNGVESLCNHLRFPGQAPLAQNDDMLGVILFDYDDDRLRNYEAQLIREIAALARSVLQERPSARLIVVGHTSEEGTSEHNYQLSVRRAMMVRRGLESEGINSQQVIWEAFGELRPVAENVTENGRRLNRRAEVRVLR